MATLSTSADPALPAPASSIAAAGSPVSRGHLVATYHYIRWRNSDGVTGITPREFAEQVKAIQSHHRVVTMDEYVAMHQTETGLALITFDDALRDQFLAAEILDSLHVSGVFFAPMRPYSDEPDRWCTQHLLHALAQKLGWAELERRVEPHLAGVEINQAEADRLYHYEVPEKRRLKYALAFALPASQAAEVLREINADVGMMSEEWYLTVDHLRALEDAGHALGGHGFDHVPYTTLSSRQQAEDMLRAMQTMNRRFGTRPRAMAYPFGRYTSSTEALARACGYTHMFTTEDRVDAKVVPDELARRARGSLA